MPISVDGSRTSVDWVLHLRCLAVDLATLIIQAVAAIATAVAAIAAVAAARAARDSANAARDSARDSALDLEEERKSRRIEGLQRLHEVLVELQSISDMGSPDWQTGISRFRAARFSVSERLDRCADFNNAWFRGKARVPGGPGETQIRKHLKHAIDEVERAITRTRKARPVGDTDHAV
jgi:hypothetical protein